MTSEPWIRQKALIVVRTYPTPARKGAEVSCTAAITEDGRWLRLFPLPYRYLDDDKRFKKYQWISVDTRRSSDPRPESHEINPDSIVIESPVIKTARKWETRKEIVMPLKSHCLCCLETERKASGAPTLGFFKPHQIERFIIRNDRAEWTESELGRLSQLSFGEKAPFQRLEKIPYKFIYKFRCDHETCRGHHLSCTDWELGQSYRKWRKRYGDRWKWAIRNKYEFEMMVKNDTYFYVGTVRMHPNSWIIVGLWYPRL